MQGAVPGIGESEVKLTDQADPQETRPSSKVVVSMWGYVSTSAAIFGRQPGHANGGGWGRLLSVLQDQDNPHRAE